MVELELFILIVINSLILYTVNRRVENIDFDLKTKTIDQVRVIKKAFTKQTKYKPYVNDDYKAWLNENKNSNF